MTFSDSRIAKMLMNDFIPVWESVAPVRTVTFDLGEGRKLKGSVSGEIAIYFCDTDGKVFDILPALQSPAATLVAMKEAKRFYGEMEKVVIKKVETPNKIPGIPVDSNLDIIILREATEREKMIKNYHRSRMKKIAAKRYDLLKSEGMQILKNPEKLSASKVYPNSAKGEELREAYINAAIDDGTRDMRMMAMSKTAARGTRNLKGIYIDSAITVVEPGGRGYYQWKIGKVFHDVTISVDSKSSSKFFPVSVGMKTPEQLKLVLFEGILKQELKGGEVEYHSDSLKAINLFEE